jgi:hypothetical protein
MDALGPYAVLTCVACIVAKWLFAANEARLRRELDEEATACRAARAEMDRTVNQLGGLALNLKQLKTRKLNAGKALKVEEKAQQEYQRMEEEEKEKAEKQETLMRQSKHRKRRQTAAGGQHGSH